jgi:putative endopeptidase
MVRTCVVLLFIAFVHPLLAQDSTQSLGFNVAQLDRSADPCADFYRYVCGTWMKIHPIPPDRSAWDPYYEMEESIDFAVRRIMDGREPGTGEDYRKVRAFYSACMDETTTEKRGLQALTPSFAQLADVSTIDSSVGALATVQTLEAGALFLLYADQDLEDAEQVIANVDYGSLGMGDREYYVATDAPTMKIRDSYRLYVARMLQYSGLSQSASMAGANAVMKIETSMAEAMPTRADRRNPSTQYHKLTFEQLQLLNPRWPWRAYFNRLRLKLVASLNVTSPPYLRSVTELWLGLTFEEQKSYLRWQIVHALSAAMPARFVHEQFNFSGKLLAGAKEEEPRWKRCQLLTNNALGEAVGKVFVQNHFSARTKERAQAEILSIEKALRDDIAHLDWMSDVTRDHALRKLDAFRVKIGYPNKWRDYGGLVVRFEDALGNVVRANRFEFARQLRKIGKPVDRDEWFSLPQDVDGYQSASLVEIVFTAGLLQPPFFDERIDDAVNYGAIGRAMGHEFTHGFDDHGRKFDEHGNLRDWWTPVDESRFAERAQCFVEQYSQFEVVDGKKLNGKLTLGENMADNGGLRLAYAALQHQLTAGKVSETGELTPDQRFFVAFAETQCDNVTDEARRHRLLTDPHAPGRWRVNGTVQNLPEFQKAFACKNTDVMVSTHRCRVW